MKKENERINFNNITDDDIERWNTEIRDFNQIHIEDDELKNADPALKYKIDEISNYLLMIASQMEKQITNDLHDLLSDGAYFVELEHRFKSKKRLMDKIYSKVINNFEDPLQVGKKVADTLRYTIIFDFDTYIEQVDDYLTSLEEMGYKVIKFKNRWGEVYYKGINVHVEDEEHRKFEIQFHTKENYDIKEIFSREPYNLIRSSNVPNELLIKAHLLRRIYQKRVHIPENALSYQYESKSKKRSR